MLRLLHVQSVTIAVPYMMLDEVLKLLCLLGLIHLMLCYGLNDADQVK